MKKGFPLEPKIEYPTNRSGSPNYNQNELCFPLNILYSLANISLEQNILKNKHNIFQFKLFSSLKVLTFVYIAILPLKHFNITI